MAAMDYLNVPPAATLLHTEQSTSEADNDYTPPGMRPATKIRTSLPHPPKDQIPTGTSSPTASTSPMSPMNILPSILLSTSIPANASMKARGDQALLSSRDPLSIQIMTVNFRRFVSRVGPIFWLQDRVEEIIMWRRGWMLTSTWMALYAFLCYFPRLLFLLPHLVLIAIILATSQYPRKSSIGRLAEPGPVTEGSVDWQANIQAIQNLMGFYADADTLAQPILAQLSWKSESPYTPHILVVLVVTLIPSIILVSLPNLPIRTICLVLGLTPFLLTHPYMLAALTRLRALRCEDVVACLPLILARWSEKWPGLQRLIDNDNLSDECWRAEMREVHLFENERLKEGVNGTWSKDNLRPGERAAWTRGQDGWSAVDSSGSLNTASIDATDVAVDDNGFVSNLTFSLAPGWKFVESEDWRTDMTASWSLVEGGDPQGWVYTNDVWLGPKRVHDQAKGTRTRRRRWTRRIWYSGTQGK